MTLKLFLKALYKIKYIILFLLVFLCVLTQRFLNERQNGLVNSVSSDGIGYYCYLPAAILYQDFTYAFYNNTSNKINSFYKPDIKPNKEAKLVNKYYVGTSLCLLPFFLLATFISYLAGTDLNGYTDTYLMLVSIAAVFYFVLSAFLLSRITKFLRINENIGFIVTLFFFFGTNLYHYVVQEPSMSHVYSFFAIVLFLFFCTKIIEDTSWRNLMFLSLTLGLVAVIRPPNIIVVLFFPFFFESFKDFKKFIEQLFSKEHYLAIILSLISFFSIISIQLFMFYLQTGKFYLVSYEGETFNFLKPEFYNVFLSYRKGLFIYVPLIFFFLLFIITYRGSLYKKAILAVVLFVFSYITSSWWCWWYGYGLSIRPFVDILPLMIVALIYFIGKLSDLSARLTFLAATPFVLYHQIISYQYSNSILEPENMDKQKFWDIFLETSMANVNAKKIKRLRANYMLLKKETYDFEQLSSGGIVNEGFESLKSCFVGADNPYSMGFSVNLKEFANEDSLIVLSECDIKTIEKKGNISLALSVDEDSNLKQWNFVFANQFSKDNDGWRKVSMISVLTKDKMTANSVLKIFAMADKGKNLVDNIHYEIYKKTRE